MSPTSFNFSLRRHHKRCRSLDWQWFVCLGQSFAYVSIFSLKMCQCHFGACQFLGKYLQGNLLLQQTKRNHSQFVFFTSAFGLWDNAEIYLWSSLFVFVAGYQAGLDTLWGTLGCMYVHLAHLSSLLIWSPKPTVSTMVSLRRTLVSCRSYVRGRRYTPFW